MSHEVSTPTDSVSYDLPEGDLGILVGFDGSANSVRALEYGARLALRRKTKLTVVMTYKVPVNFYATYAAIPAVPEYEYRRRDAEQTLDRARELLEDFPGVSAVATVEGDSVGALAKITERAQTVIVGARGRGGLLGRVLGSVAAALPAHAKCPTIVIPGDEDEAEPLSALDLDPRPNEAPVFAGVDGSQLSRIAALAAAEIASEAETALSLVTALHPLDESILWYGGASAAIPEVTHQMRQELADHLDAEVAWVKRHFPDLQVEGSVRVGQPDQVLEEASHRGQLTVVGCRGRGGLRSALLGSTSRSLLHHMAGPVMVVPQLADDRVEDEPETR
ncbi:universal stress protein [Brevibacterium epidermidis]|uniref:universal stress protein n=1 Tax=Brevibacterium epidermidis TaxID=1698 RepID=UPI000BF4BF69|nr:universal stress protein [Brevibacterium epidermidis]